MSFTASTSDTTPSFDNAFPEPELAMLEQLVLGDFSPPSAPLETRAGECIELIRQQLGATIGQSSHLIKELNSNAATLSQNCSDSVSAATKDISQDLAGARETRDRLTAVAAAAEQITVNVSSIAENASESQSSLDTIADTTTELTSAAEEIASNTEKARSITTQAVADTELATGEFAHLEAAAEEISKVTDTISEVSDQTKLLALNATIEAARAGDAGRGFAVVASEVKELASQTNLANADIKQKIEVIQTAIGSTLGSMKNVSKVIAEVNEIVATIAAAAEEQSLATNSISTTLGTATEGLGSMNTNVSEGSLAINEMNENLSTSVIMTTKVIEFLETMAVDNETMLDDATKNFADIATLQSRGDDIALLYQNYQTDPALANVDTSEQGLFRFGPQWSVLVEDMDAEHRKIFAYCNEIHSKVANGAKQQQILTVLKDLATFTTQHFAEEEKLMQRHAYPGLASQKSAHTALLGKVANVIKRIEAGEHVNMIEVIVFLTAWLKGHILGEDLKYGEYFQQQGISV
ncbi:hypothetical protein A9Q89_01185 [Gammaproteobacteria bacterium 53_120_T64]|nr:hypothetical protein A9Q89_01185 [Gammaproteobacteria bacterium 53_120_T64]